MCLSSCRCAARPSHRCGCSSPITAPSTAPAKCWAGSTGSSCTAADRAVTRRATGDARLARAQGHHAPRVDARLRCRVPAARMAEEFRGRSTVPARSRSASSSRRSAGTGPACRPPYCCSTPTGCVPCVARSAPTSASTISTRHCVGDGARRVASAWPGRAGDVSQRRLLHDRRPSVRASARVGLAVVGDTGGDPSQVPPPRPHVVGGRRRRAVRAEPPERAPRPNRLGRQSTTARDVTQ